MRLATTFWVLLWCLNSALAWNFPRIQSPPPPSLYRFSNHGVTHHHEKSNRTRSVLEDDDPCLEESPKRAVVPWSLVLWNSFRTSTVFLAVRIVLFLELEKQVVTRLPAKILLVVLKTCLRENARPRILRLVALELDNRIQEEISKFTGKETYQFGDIAKAGVSKITGKDTYQFGDITKAGVSKITGKDTYQFGDITKTGVSKITGKETYKFGDVTRAAVAKITAKDEYEFGDISRSILAKLSGKEKYRYGDFTYKILREQQLRDTSSKYSSGFDGELNMLKEMQKEGTSKNRKRKIINIFQRKPKA